MFTRFVACALLIAVCPLTVQAQLFKRGKKDNNQTTVVHHTGSVGVYGLSSPAPIYHSHYYPAYSPVIAEVAPVVTASYAPVVTYTPAVAPSPRTEVIVNKLPLSVPASVPVRSVAQEIKLSNPHDNNGAIHYTLNSNSYSIQPGETQTIVLDRDWVLRFDNGYNRQVVYRLTQGFYEFTVTDEAGWDVVKRSSETIAAPSMVASKFSMSNRIPQRSNSTPVNAITRIEANGQ